MLKLWAAAVLMTAVLAVGAMTLTAQSDAAWHSTVATADVQPEQ